MKKLLLATTALALLSAPAIAADQMHQGRMQPNAQYQTPSSPQMNHDQQAGAIAPTSLDAQQIRHMQRALNQRGFDAGSVDGIWGPETAAAVKSFQERQNIQANGDQLNWRTLSALGVSNAGTVQPGSGSNDETTGSGSHMNRNSPAPTDTSRPSNMNRTEPSGTMNSGSTPSRQ